ncbi:MAG: polysaccharide biosynthesis/export family protein [Muribaculaceae bacterium]|nr:polysaccharide biosynthesis/export family protein [Muribaculaceae bacterium]
MKNTILILCAVVVLALTGCRTPRDITYMQGWQDGETHAMVNLNSIKARPDDKLSIIVNTENPVLSESLNLPTYTHRLGQSQSGMGSSSQSQNVSLYTVDQSGDINFPLMGRLHVEGMTRSQIAEYVAEELERRNIAKNPVIIVDWANVGVTIAGEVASPGRYALSRDLTTLPEVLAMAGDLTIQGQRTNVLVVRTEGDKTVSYRVDLTDGDAVQKSPVYFVRQNDYVYVEPNNMKKRSATVNGNNVLQASFWVSIASLVTSIAVLVFK